MFVQDDSKSVVLCMGGMEVETFDLVAIMSYLLKMQGVTEEKM